MKVEPLRFYQVGSFAVGNRLDGRGPARDEVLEPGMAASDRPNKGGVWRAARA